jgi:hypothetical protein
MLPPTTTLLTTDKPGELHAATRQMVDDGYVIDIPRDRPSRKEGAPRPASLLWLCWICWLAGSAGCWLLALALSSEL